jgi:hypothetical protein
VALKYFLKESAACWAWVEVAEVIIAPTGRPMLEPLLVRPVRLALLADEAKRSLTILSRASMVCVSTPRKVRVALNSRVSVEKYSVRPASLSCGSSTMANSRNGPTSACMRSHDTTQHTPVVQKIGIHSPCSSDQLLAGTLINRVCLGPSTFQTFLKWSITGRRMSPYL